MQMNIFKFECLFFEVRELFMDGIFEQGVKVGVIG